MSKEFNYPRDFKGIWIPKEIWLDDDLNATDKIIFAEIDSLDVEDSEGCYASNEYLSNFCKCSITKVSTSISKLISLGYVRVAKSDGRKRWLKTCLSKFERQNYKNKKPEIQEMKERNIPIDINDKYSDKNSSNDANKSKSKSIKKADTSKQKDVLKPQVDTLIPKKQLLTRTPEKKTRSELKKLEADMIDRFSAIASQYELSDACYRNTVKAFKHYLDKYTERANKVHPILSNNTLEKIFETFAMVNDTEYGHFEKLSEIEPGENENGYLDALIDEHFRSKHGQGTDWHISHFASIEYLEKMAQHVVDW